MVSTKFNNIKLSLLSNDFNNHVTSHTEISLDATIDSSSELYLESWLQLITLNEFQIQAKKDNLFSYLITNLVIIPYTSDELYWKSNKFTEKFNQSLMLPIHKRSSYKYNIMLLLATIVLLYILAESYFSDQSLMNNILNFNTIYYNNHNKNNNHNTITSQELTIPKSEAVVPQKLITNCLIQYDLFFSKFNNWTLTSIRCDSLSLEFNFMPNNLNNLNVDNFIQQLKSITTKNINYTDKSNKHYNGKIIFSNNLLKYQDNYNLNYYNHLKTSAKLTKYEVVNQLQQFANQYNFKLNIPHSLGDKVEYKKIKFIIESTQSPFYLMKVHVFDNLLLNNISMHIVENNGFYLWKTQGEI